MNAENSRDTTRWLSQLVARPPDTVQHLPLNYRWEFTRRHPYYQMFWNVPHDTASSDEPEATYQREIAELILAQINVSGDTIPPKTEWDDMSLDESWRIWTEGALSRIQLKGLVATLIGALSRNSLRSLSTLLWQASEIEDGDTAAEYRLLKSVMHGDFPGFEHYLPNLIVTVSPSASEKSIAAAASKIICDFRDEHDLDATRIRTDKFDAYLRAWDLREGWHSGSYYRDLERRLKVIAKETGLSDATVCDHYKSAFNLITGMDYSPDSWLNIVGKFKAAGFLGDGYGPIARRAGRTRSIAGDSESGFTSDGNFLESCFPSVDDVEFDVISNELLDSIRSDTPIDDIMKQFDLESTVKPAIKSLRDQFHEPI